MQISVNDEFIEKTVNHIRELEYEGIFKTKGIKKYNELSEVLHEIQDTLRVEEKEIPRVELLEKIELIQSLVSESINYSKKEYFKFGLETKVKGDKNDR